MTVSSLLSGTDYSVGSGLVSPSSTSQMYELGRASGQCLIRGAADVRQEHDLEAFRMAAAFTPDQREVLRAVWLSGYREGQKVAHADLTAEQESERRAEEGFAHSLVMGGYPELPEVC